MSDNNSKKSLQIPLTFFLTGLLGTASTLIALEKYKVAVYCVLVGAGCALVVSIVLWLVNRMHPEGD
jgi:lipid-A-disaccharide synthase-like uncharacterized protein